MPAPPTISSCTVLKVAMRKRDEIRDREQGYVYQKTRRDKGRKKDIPVPTWNPGGP